MTCTNCGEEMHGISDDVFGRQCLWCPECGTVATSSTDETERRVWTFDTPNRTRQKP